MIVTVDLYNLSFETSGCRIVKILSYPDYYAAVDMLPSLSEGYQGTIKTGEDEFSYLVRLFSETRYHSDCVYFEIDTSDEDSSYSYHLIIMPDGHAYFYRDGEYKKDQYSLHIAKILDSDDSHNKCIICESQGGFFRICKSDSQKIIGFSSIGRIGYKESIFRVKSEDGDGVIAVDAREASFRYILPPKYRSIRMVGDSSLVAVDLEDGMERALLYDLHDNAILIDGKEGIEEIKLPRPVSREGIYQVRKNGLWGIWKERLIIEARYSSIFMMEHSSDNGILFKVIGQDGKSGVFDSTGRMILECKYDHLRCAPDAQDRYGYYNVGGEITVDKKGKKRISGGLWGVVSLDDGFELIPARFDRMRPFNCGYAAVRVNGGWGLVDRSGTTIVDFTHKLVSDVKKTEDKYYCYSYCGSQGERNYEFCIVENTGLIHRIIFDKNQNLLNDLRVGVKYFKKFIVDHSQKIYEAPKSSYDDEPEPDDTNWEEETWYAMTDGQYGPYPGAGFNGDYSFMGH